MTAARQTGRCRWCHRTAEDARNDIKNDAWSNEDGDTPDTCDGDPKDPKAICPWQAEVSRDGDEFVRSYNAFEETEEAIEDIREGVRAAGIPLGQRRP